MKLYCGGPARGKSYKMKEEIIKSINSGINLVAIAFCDEYKEIFSQNNCMILNEENLDIPKNKEIKFILVNIKTIDENVYFNAFMSIYYYIKKFNNEKINLFIEEINILSNFPKAKNVLKEIEAMNSINIFATFQELSIWKIL